MGRWCSGGTIRIENDDGAWDADYLGIYTTETGDVGATVFTGSGDYEALSCGPSSLARGLSRLARARAEIAGNRSEI